MMNYEIDSEVFELINRLRQMQEKAESLATQQHELRDQLIVAKETAHEVQRKLLLDQRHVGGEG